MRIASLVLLLASWLALAPAGLAEGAQAPDAAVDPDTIVNPGATSWVLIQPGDSDEEPAPATAGAIPRGITSMTELQGWQAPVGKTLVARIPGAFGGKGQTLQFRLVFLEGGSVGGEGRYITGLSFLAMDVSSSIFQTMYGDAHVFSVENVGTPQDPVAEMTVSLAWGKYANLLAPEYFEQATLKIRGDTSSVELDSDSGARNLSMPLQVNPISD